MTRDDLTHLEVAVLVVWRQVVYEAEDLEGLLVGHVHHAVRRHRDSRHCPQHSSGGQGDLNQRTWDMVKATR